MKTLRSILVLSIVLITPMLGLAQGADLASPKNRDEAVERALALLAAAEFLDQPEALVSPFAPPNFDQPDPGELLAQQAAAASSLASRGVSRPMGPRGVLEMLAERIVPSGILKMGGQSILLFGQKKLKVGDRLTITFDGIDYDLDITTIGDTNFTLRYQGEEITRSIKPGKKP